MPPAQQDLFGAPAPALPPGMRLEEDFLEPSEEQDLIAFIARLDLREMRYKGYTARRRVASFGGSYDFDVNRLEPAAPLPPGLQPLRDRVAAWVGLPPAAFVHALVAEYRPGTPLGWHRDVPDFEDVVGVSLMSEAVMRLRPWPPETATRSDTLRLALAPRSIYLLRGPARWAWQHSVLPTEGLRYSITFRTARAGFRR